MEGMGGEGKGSEGCVAGGRSKRKSWVEGTGSELESESGSSSSGGDGLRKRGAAERGARRGVDIRGGGLQGCSGCGMGEVVGVEWAEEDEEGAPSRVEAVDGELERDERSKEGSASGSFSFSFSEAG